MQYYKPSYVRFQIQRGQFVSDILSLKTWPTYLILMLAAGSINLLCSTFPRARVESVAPKQVSKSEANKSMVIYFFNEVVGQGNKDAVNALLEGKQVPVKGTKAVGCSVKFKKS